MIFETQPISTFSRATLNFSYRYELLVSCLELFEKENTVHCCGDLKRNKE